MPELFFIQTTVLGMLVRLVESPRAVESAIPLGDAGLVGPRLSQGHLPAAAFAFSVSGFPQSGLAFQVHSIPL